MTWVLTTVLCIILVEFVVRLPLPTIISDMLTTTRKALHTLGAKSVSDHWKEKVMLSYAGSLFTSTMKLAGFLVSIGVIIILLILIFDYFGIWIGNFIASGTGIVFSVVVATAYYKIRKVFV